jgi:hypothetical protein
MTRRGIPRIITSSHANFFFLPSDAFRTVGSFQKIGSYMPLLYDSARGWLRGIYIAINVKLYAGASAPSRAVNAGAGPERQRGAV